MLVWHLSASSGPTQPLQAVGHCPKAIVEPAASMASATAIGRPTARPRIRKRVGTVAIDEDLISTGSFMSASPRRPPRPGRSDPTLSSSRGSPVKQKERRLVQEGGGGS